MRILTVKDHTKQELLDVIVPVIKAGGLVVLPSDTVYGLCVDGRSEKAVEKLISFKKRPKGKPISVFVGSLKRAQKYTSCNSKQSALLNRLTPGPYTFVLHSKGVLNAQLESEKGTLGIRIPDYPLINKLVEQLDFPITATSANSSGSAPHYSIESLMKSLSAKKGDEIDLIIDVGKLPYNKPSTVLDLSGDQLNVLRSGGKGEVREITSTSSLQTQQVGKELIADLVGSVTSKPIIIILQGELGAGKTAMVKGIGEYLGISNIVSPTYVVCYEYETKHQTIKKFHHCDFYNVSESEELHYLGIDKMVTPNSLIAIEWGEKSGPIFELLKQNAQVLLVRMEYKSEKSRHITITYLL